MSLCSVCKKNTAVVFVNRIVDGKPKLEGLCLSCAKERGINPLASMMKQYGASEEDIANLNEQFEEIVSSLSSNEMDVPEELIAEMEKMENPEAFSSMLSNIFPNATYRIPPVKKPIVFGINIPQEKTSSWVDIAHDESGPTTRIA